MTKKRIVWLCVLAVAAICAAVWLWPRSMEKVAGVAMEDVERWVFIDTTELDEPIEELAGGAEELAGLYTFRFSRPYPCTSLISHEERIYRIVLLSEGPNRHDLVIRSDGKLWTGTMSYELSGGQKELERLNRWFADVMGEPAEQAG